MEGGQDEEGALSRQAICIANGAGDNEGAEASREAEGGEKSGGIMGVSACSGG